jgi:hypothetical protein
MWEPARNLSDRNSLAQRLTPLMARRLYMVELHGKEWYVRVGQGSLGPFLTRNQAIDAAIDAASLVDSAEVVVRTPQGPFDTVWPRH